MNRGSGIRDGGKKFDTWTIWKDNSPIEVPVRMHTRTGRMITFSAEYPPFDMRWSGFTDINVLRETVTAEIKAHEVIAFEPKLQIEVQAVPHFYARKEDLERLDAAELAFGTIRETCSIEVKRFLLSKNQIENKSRFSGKDQKTWKAKDHPTDTSSDYWLSDPEENDQQRITLLDDTLENRLALQEIIDGMTRLRIKMLDLLSQKKIGLTVKLLNTNRINLLPPASEDGK